MGKLEVKHPHAHRTASVAARPVDQQEALCNDHLRGLLLMHCVLLCCCCTFLSQVAGLPPVTKDWFEARKAQLSTAAAAPHTKIWYDPLTKKKFQTQQTYQVGAVDTGFAGLSAGFCGGGGGVSDLVSRFEEGTVQAVCRGALLLVIGVRVCQDYSLGTLVHASELCGCGGVGGVCCRHMSTARSTSSL
jgi:hypothetical protein